MSIEEVLSFLAYYMNKQNRKIFHLLLVNVLGLVYRFILSKGCLRLRVPCNISKTLIHIIYYYTINLHCYWPVLLIQKYKYLNFSICLHISYCIICTNYSKILIHQIHWSTGCFRTLLTSFMVLFLR